MYRYILRESCSQFDSLPLTYFSPIDPSAADNGVRLPKHNAVTFNVFHDYGVWDKQSAAYHKALAPGNAFSWNIVFNASRHGVNFQDSMGGGGVVDGNVFFSLNRETHDTAALNSWGRRNYLFTDDDAAPTTPHLIPSKVSVLLCTVTFYANLAHSLTRSP